MAFAAFSITRASAQDDVDVSSGTRLESVMAAVRARDAKAAPALAARFAGETNAAVRAAIVRGVAVLSPAGGAALAKTALSDPQPAVRLAGAESLARAQDAAAVPDLAAALAGETNAGVRHTIAFWLGSFKTPAARAALAQALGSDPDPNVRVQAALSLQRHGTSAARAALKAGRSDSDERVRRIAGE